MSFAGLMSSIYVLSLILVDWLWIDIVSKKSLEKRNNGKERAPAMRLWG